MVWFCVWEAPLGDWANGGTVAFFSRMVSMVLVIWRFKGNIMLHYFRLSEMSAELHSRNLILGINCYPYDIHTKRKTVVSNCQQFRVWLRQSRIVFREGKISICFSVLILRTFCSKPMGRETVGLSFLFL